MSTVTAAPLDKNYQIAHYMESIVRSCFVKETHLSSRASASFRRLCVPGESHCKLERQNRLRTRSPRWAPLTKRLCACETAKAETISTGCNMKHERIARVARSLGSEIQTSEIESLSSRSRCEYFARQENRARISSSSPFVRI
jgi:hypothetical protein